MMRMKGMFRLAFALVLPSTVLSLWIVGLPKLQMAYASPYNEIDVETAYNMITNGSYPELVVLDVRNQSEYDPGHIYGAVWIPVWQLETRIDELANHKSHEIIVYCKAGGRSATASDILDSEGFTKVYNMLGGIEDWQSAGYPVWIATVHNVNTTFNYDTIQAAIDAPQTLADHTIFVDEGTYYEHVALNKSLKLIGETRSTTIIDGNYTENVVEIVANNVKITGFTVQNSNQSDSYCGIYIGESAAGTNISYNFIKDSFYALGLWHSSNNSICQNEVTMSNFGLLLNTSSNNIISRNNITHNLRGIAIKYSSSNNTVSDNNIEINDFGVWVYFSSNNTLSKNKIVYNNYDGIQLTSSSNNTFSGNEIKTNNHYGIRLSSSYNNTFCHNNLDNTDQVYIDPPSLAGFWDDGFEGNYWSNYAGVDLDNDGIGDSVHEIDGNNTDHYPLMGMFHIFDTSLGYTIDVISNSTIEDFWYSDYNTTIIMHVSNVTADQIFGFCRLRIPNALINETFQVTINGEEPDYWNYTLFEDDSNSWIYFSYQHSTLEIIIIPEFSSFLLLLLLMIATLLAVAIYKKRPFQDFLKITKST